VKAHVLHVPGVGREPYVDAIRADLGAENVCVHSDPERNGAMWNWRTVIECMVTNPSDDEWTLVLNDDVVPLPRWRDELKSALKFSPKPLLGLAYVGLQGDRGFKRGVPYVVGPYLLAGAAIAYHRSVLDQSLLEFANDAAATGYKHDDIAVNVFCHEVLATYPALVTRSLFGIPRIGSLMGHYFLPEPSHTIAEAGPLWWSQPRYIPENRARIREDEGLLLTMMESAR
jgi:hypothetical protein